MPIQGIRNPERLAHTPGARGQIPFAASPSGHDAQALNRIDGPYEHGTWIPHSASNHVQTPMDPIAEVDVSGSRRPEHGGIPSRPTDTGRRMGSRIIRARVSLDFDDDSYSQSPAHRGHESCTE